MNVTFDINTTVPLEVVSSATGWKQLTTTPTSCSRVWLGAPTASHPKGSPNTSSVLVAVSSAAPATTAGAIPLLNDNYLGFFRHVRDASYIWLYFGTSGDCVEVAAEIERFGG